MWGCAGRAEKRLSTIDSESTRRMFMCSCVYAMFIHISIARAAAFITIYSYENIVIYSFM